MYVKTTASHLYGGQRFYSLNNYCKNIFHEKVYRLSLNGGMSCPNRDGKLSTIGCLYCSEGGSGDFASPASLSISDQIDVARQHLISKTNCQKFIAYFQAYTNTYAPVDYLRQLFTEAINHPDIVALSIGTRSDCLSDEIYQLLDELNQIKPVWIELGLQSIHESTLKSMNTHTTVIQFDSAVYKLQERKIPVIAHLILGLPGENKEMMLESVKHVAALQIDGVKLQLLHVLAHTPLAEIYEKKPFPLFTMEEYCNLIVDCIELLPPDTVIHRMTGDGPRKLLIAPLWSTDKKRVLNSINHLFKERDTYQGRLYCPTNTSIKLN